MTIKEVDLIVGLSALVHFALEAAECVVWWAYNKLAEWKYAKRKGRGK